MTEFKIGNYEVKLDPDKLAFSEENINKFLAEFAGNYDHYNEMQTLAQSQHDRLKADYENQHAACLVIWKEAGSSDKLAQAKADTDPDVKKLQDAMLVAHYKARRLYGYLRSMDKAYESAKEFCYNLRKEMDKLYGSVLSDPWSKKRQPKEDEE